jgi:hypothetical protein
MVQLARCDHYVTLMVVNRDELGMDVPEIKSIMREHFKFAGMAADPNPLASADWDRVACPGGRPLHPPGSPLRGPLSGLMDVC